MSTFDWKRELHRKDHQVILADQPIAIHCHHYNINLQKTLEDSLGDEGIALIYRSAEKAAYDSLKPLLEQYREIKTLKSRLEMFAVMYQNCGLGILHPQTIDARGGRIISSSSHHVTGWLAKHGRRSTPGCHFTCGWIAGAFEVIQGKPSGSFLVKEIQCKMTGASDCIFLIGV
jgi:hypothetical protein